MKLTPNHIDIATRLMREGRLREAVAAIQGGLGGHHSGSDPRGDGQGPLPHGPAFRRMPEETAPMGAWRLPEGFVPPGVQPSSPPHLPDGAQFREATFANEAGSRAYKLFVPSGYTGQQPLPLVVMLHGCTQSPDDFAVGTRMNDVGEARNVLVAYPGQAKSANASRCWNWFNPADQQRDRGEPSLIAGITRQVMRQYRIDARRVYVAGLSAGGAAAAVMGGTYPDLYAAIGVHSGLACGAARDVGSAFRAMREGSRPSDGDRTSGTSAPQRAIVFHGDRDSTVHPVNGGHVIEQSRATADLRQVVFHGETGGRRYTRTVHEDARGSAILENWVLHGAGHAWSGGSPAGSYTDQKGPDASREMVRFFLQQP